MRSSKRRRSTSLSSARRRGRNLPPDLAYAAIGGLSTELREKLEPDRPANLGQASRLDGMTPAALLLLLAHLKKASCWKTA